MAPGSVEPSRILQYLCSLKHFTRLGGGEGEAALLHTATVQCACHHAKTAPGRQQSFLASHVRVSGPHVLDIMLEGGGGRGSERMCILLTSTHGSRTHQGLSQPPAPGWWFFGGGGWVAASVWAVGKR